MGAGAAARRDNRTIWRSRWRWCPGREGEHCLKVLCRDFCRAVGTSDEDCIDTWSSSAQSGYALVHFYRTHCTTFTIREIKTGMLCQKTGPMD